MQLSGLFKGFMESQEKSRERPSNNGNIVCILEVLTTNQEPTTLGKLTGSPPQGEGDLVLSLFFVTVTYHATVYAKQWFYTEHALLSTYGISRMVICAGNINHNYSVENFRGSYDFGDPTEFYTLNDILNTYVLYIIL